MRDAWLQIHNPLHQIIFVMAKTIFYNDSHLAPEYRFLYTSGTGNSQIVHISGVIKCDPKELIGHEKDQNTQDYLVVVNVGPWFSKIQEVIPNISVSGFENTNSDEDNFQRWLTPGISFKIVNVGPNSDKQIQLHISAHVKGQYSCITHFSYQLVVKGQLNPLTRVSPLSLDYPTKSAKQGSIARGYKENVLTRKDDTFIHAVSPVTGTDMIIMSGKKSTQKLVSKDAGYSLNKIEFLLDPIWAATDNATVYINLAAFENTESDTDDASGWKLINPKWEKMKGFGPSQSEYKIKVSFDLPMIGDHSKVQVFSYMIFATGVLSEGGLDKKLEKISHRLPEIDVLQVALDLNVRNVIQYSPERRMIQNMLNKPNEYYQHILLSGFVQIRIDDLVFIPDADGNVTGLTLNIPVGPYFREIKSAVPRIILGGIDAIDPDEEEVCGFNLNLESLSVIKNVGMSSQEKMLNLQCTISEKTYKTSIMEFQYCVSIIGRLGEQGISNPQINPFSEYILNNP